MKPKTGNAAAKPRVQVRNSAAKKRKVEPLEVKLTVAFNFGDEPDDRIVVMDDVKIPMVNSVFASRDRIVRGFAHMLLSAGLKQPKVVQEVFPAFKLLRRFSKSS